MNRFAIFGLAGLATTAHADLFFTGQSFEVINAVAAADFFTRLGTPALANINESNAAFNTELGYGFTISSQEIDLGTGRSRVILELTHDGYTSGSGDFYPTGFELNNLTLEHRVFGFGGSSEPSALLAPVALNLEWLSYETFAFDGTTETQLDNFTPITQSTEWTGGIGYWSPPPGATAGLGINRIVWTADFALVPAPASTGLLALAGLAAARRRR